MHVFKLILSFSLMSLLTPAYLYAQEALFAGDVTLTRNISPSQKEFFTQTAKDRINEADLFIWNLEFSGASSNKKDKQFVFSCDSDIAHTMGFKNGVANVANNHSFDGNVEGFKNLITSLDKYGIKYCGLKNPEPQKNYVEFSSGDNRFFIVGYTPMSRSNHPVYDTVPYDYALETVKYLNTIKSGENDYIIVNIHDGIEKTKQISPRQREAARQFASLGADIVNFSHSHTYIDPEKIGDTLVLWGTGNFIFGGNKSWCNNPDVRMVSVDLKNKTWRWLRGNTKNYVFNIHPSELKQNSPN